MTDRSPESSVPVASGPSVPPSPRLPSIDLLRGIAMVLMALDHARDYFAPFPHQPEDLAHASPALFLTRWVTHFCAPIFVFLAGTSIYLRQHKAQPVPAARGGMPTTPMPPAGGLDAHSGPRRPASADGLSAFLIKRGLWLVFLELTLIGACWGFIFVGITTFQVIWALGVSMVVMALLVRFPLWISLAFGAGMVLLHNLLDPISNDWLRAQGLHSLVPLWSILHEQNFISFNPTAEQPFTPPGIFVVYPLIPWIGVMALGYAFGPIARRAPARRATACLLIGGGAIIAFLLLRATNLYGEPTPFDAHTPDHPLLALLNTTKYPPSLLYLLMTLGPALLAIPLLDRLRGPIATILLTFGRVPLFFYILHIPLLHLSSAILWYARFGVISGWQLNPASFPPGYQPSLALAYAAWALAVAILYLPCRWFMRLKRRRTDWWLSYL